MPKELDGWLPRMWICRILRPRLLPRLSTHSATVMWVMDSAGMTVVHFSGNGCV